MITKVRNLTLLAVAVLLTVIVFGQGVPRGWVGSDMDDGGKRTITLIGYASNNSLEITTRVQTSLQGVILWLSHEPVDDDSWEYSFEVIATEHVVITFQTWVTRNEPGDRSSTRCRIEDNGDKVSEERAVVRDNRRDTIAMCQYRA